MRILKLMAKSLIIIAVVGVIGALLVREVWLFMAVSQLKSSLSVMRSTAIKRDYLTLCQEKGTSYLEGSEYATLQLRFLSPTEYVVEVICGQYSLDPIVLEQKSLPPLVTKLPGNAGVLWGKELSAVEISTFGRSAAVGLIDETVVRVTEPTSLGVGPTSVCAGYSFHCCQEASEVGAGEQLTGVTDCPKSCFSQCKTRPVVLLFRTDPFMNRETETVTASAGESIEFSYLIGIGTAQSASVVLDYGDGQADQLSELEGSRSHTYQCDRGQCEYNARLTATDDRGAVSADLPISVIKIVIQ